MATIENGVHYARQSVTMYAIDYEVKAPTVRTVQKWYREIVGKTLPASSVEAVGSKGLRITSILHYTNKPDRRWWKFVGKLEQFGT